MKSIYLVLIITFFGLTSCDTSNPPTELDLPPMEWDATGTISGADPAMCPCCGGWIISIDGDETIYRFESLPDDSEIVLDENELEVKFNWTIDRVCADYHYINIEEIELD